MLVNLKSQRLISPGHTWVERRTTKSSKVEIVLIFPRLAVETLVVMEEAKSQPLLEETAAVVEKEDNAPVEAMDVPNVTQ